MSLSTDGSLQECGACFRRLTYTCLAGAGPAVSTLLSSQVPQSSSKSLSQYPPSQDLVPSLSLLKECEVLEAFTMRLGGSAAAVCTGLCSDKD